MRRVIAFTAMDASSKDDSALSIISAMIGSSIVLSVSYRAVILARKIELTII